MKNYRNTSEDLLISKATEESVLTNAWVALVISAAAR